MVSGKPVKPGETVLCLGTGGVSMAGLLFAKAAGARVIVTSSSDEKIKRACAWALPTASITSAFRIGRKKCCNSPAATAPITSLKTAERALSTQSFEAAAFGGKVALIGFLAGMKGDINPAILMMKSGSMIGIGVGSRAMFEDMNRAIEVEQDQAVVDKVFPFDKAADAYRCQAAGDFVGKVVITI